MQIHLKLWSFLSYTSDIRFQNSVINSWVILALNPINNNSKHINQFQTNTENSCKGNYCRLWLVTDYYLKPMSGSGLDMLSDQ
jgi:hypothetical protein